VNNRGPEEVDKKERGKKGEAKSARLGIERVKGGRARGMKALRATKKGGGEKRKGGGGKGRKGEQTKSMTPTTQEASAKKYLKGPFQS